METGWSPSKESRRGLLHRAACFVAAAVFIRRRQQSDIPRRVPQQQEPLRPRLLRFWLSSHDGPSSASWNPSRPDFTARRSSFNGGGCPCTRSDGCGSPLTYGGNLPGSLPPVPLVSALHPIHGCGIAPVEPGSLRNTIGISPVQSGSHVTYRSDLPGSFCTHHWYQPCTQIPRPHA
jgi:hypothetical protein